MADNTIVNASGNSVATFPSDSFADVIHATRACWASQGESKDGIVTVAFQANSDSVNPALTGAIKDGDFFLIRFGSGFTLAVENNRLILVRTADGRVVRRQAVRKCNKGYKPGDSLWSGSDSSTPGGQQEQPEAIFDDLDDLDNLEGLDYEEFTI
jgi:hypothetical protein